MNYIKSLFFSVGIIFFFAFTTSSCKPVEYRIENNFFTDTLKSNWKIQNSKYLSVSGKIISTTKFKTHKWFSAEIPSTVLNALVNNDVYTDIFRDENMRKIPVKQFQKSWWYRKVFKIKHTKKAFILNFQGINYKANIWLNGHLISDTNFVNNAFKQYSFDVTNKVKRGKNILAVEIFPPKKGDFTIGFVDWNPAPPDKNMGIFRPVILRGNGGVGISKPFVSAKPSSDYTTADISADIHIDNYLNKPVKGMMKVIIAGKIIKREIYLEARKKKRIHFSSKEYPELILSNPILWWPYTYGNPHLYNATFLFEMDKGVSDRKSISFGIRNISSYRTKKGHRGVRINGRKILIKGGGWVDKLLLNDTPVSDEAQLDYVKDMGLNTIRLEGFWGNSEELYRLCDQKGIMIMAGWSCQWEWQNLLGKTCDKTYGGILTVNEINLMSEAWKDQILWLRNHPSIIAWFSGSDKKPKPDLENNYLNILKAFDTTRIYLASAKECSSLAGPTGMKMRGPYAYEPPVYWYSDTLFGGAFGFNTETGPGAQVPPLGSLKKMFSHKNLWPIDSVWDYHCGRGIFNSIDRFKKAIDMRYGKAISLQDFARKSQLLNYELMRPMFEAFSANRYKATGVIQWMLNSAWPQLYWQLYDAYMMPNGAYYGAKKANRPIHALYNYYKKSIYLVNDKLQRTGTLTLTVRILNLNSEIVFKKKIYLQSKPNTSGEVFSLPQNLSLTNVYFLDLRISDSAGREIDNNFYWLSKKKDILDYSAMVKPWRFHTPSKQYADFKNLNLLPASSMSYYYSINKDIKTTVFQVTMKNTGSKLAFFVNPKIVNIKTKEVILPVIWSDNYVSLLPGETRTLTATIKNIFLKDKSPELEMSAYNHLRFLKDN